jgi:hypothetical protein
MGENDYWVIKTDDAGNIQWQKNYGGSKADNPTSVIEYGNGYVICGASKSVDGNLNKNNGWEDYWIIRTDDTGKIEWQKTLGGSYPDSATCIIQSYGGGFVIAGYSFSKGTGDVYFNWGGCDYWILKLDDTGKIEWNRILGGSDDDKLTSIIQTKDGNYVAIGNSKSTDRDITENYGAQDIWIVKLDKFPLSIEPVSVSQPINIYPSLVYDKLNIELPAGYEEASIKLFSIAGQEIKLRYESGLNTSISFTDIATGMYLLQVQQDKEAQIFKIIKQ